VGTDVVELAGDVVPGGAIVGHDPETFYGLLSASSARASAKSFSLTVTVLALSGARQFLANLKEEFSLFREVFDKMFGVPIRLRQDQLLEKAELSDRPLHTVKSGLPTGVPLAQNVQLTATMVRQAKFRALQDPFTRSAALSRRLFTLHACLGELLPSLLVDSSTPILSKIRAMALKGGAAVPDVDELSPSLFSLTECITSVYEAMPSAAVLVDQLQWRALKDKLNGEARALDGLLQSVLDESLQALDTWVARC
jgi:hypothetical protein